jgi:hypothetical protein
MCRLEFVARGNNLAQFEKVVLKYYGREYSVKFPNKTRWHSMLYAIERYQLLHVVIDEFVEEKIGVMRRTLKTLTNRKTVKYNELITLYELMTDSTVSESEMQSLKYLGQILEPFTQVSRFFETKLYVIHRDLI